MIVECELSQVSTLFIPRRIPRSSAAVLYFAGPTLSDAIVYPAEMTKTFMHDLYQVEACRTPPAESEIRNFDALYRSAGVIRSLEQISYSALHPNVKRSGEVGNDEENKTASYFVTAEY